MVLLADAMHSLSDILIYSFLLVAAIWSPKEADQVHMFGYRRAQNVAALVAATLFIAFTSFRLFEEAIPRLFNPEVVIYHNLPVALGVIGISMLVPAIPLVKYLLGKERALAAKAQLMELFNDQMSTLAALIGTLFILWGIPVIDPIAVILVATLIAIDGVRLFRENLCFLLGQAPKPEELEEIKEAARSVKGVLDIGDLRAEYVGLGSLHADLHIKVRGDTSIKEANLLAAKVRQKIHKSRKGLYCVVRPSANNGE